MKPSARPQWDGIISSIVTAPKRFVHHTGTRRPVQRSNIMDCDQQRNGGGVHIGAEHLEHHREGVKQRGASLHVAAGGAHIGAA
jgi:hypothetical protein